MTTKKSSRPAKRYRNDGASQLVIDGQEINPGDEFTGQLTPELEMQLTIGGHISILEDQSASADKAQAEAAGEVMDSETTSRRRSRS